MKKIIYSFVFLLIIGFFIITSFSLAFAKFLETEKTKPEEVTGVFSLILYGGRHSNDLETVAIFDKEGDQYEFEPFAPEFDYKIKKDIPAGDALKEAKKFVSFHSSFWRSQLSRIIDEKGNMIGYELKPLYYPFVYGSDDVLEIYYRIKDGKVIVHIRLMLDVFNSFFSRDMPFDSPRGF